jgi:hypothetical protein
MKSPEHNLQVAIIQYLRINHFYCFAIPNGGRRDKATGAMLKKEGVLAGVADIEILLPYGKAIFVELKDGKTGQQSREQKSFEKEVKLRGFEYLLWRTFKDCVDFVNEDLKSGAECSNNEGMAQPQSLNPLALLRQEV